MRSGRVPGRSSAATLHTFVKLGPEPPRGAPVFRLRASFWATSQMLNPELRIARDHLELEVPRARRSLVHRVRYERIRDVRFVEGRRFTDVIIHTTGGRELVAPGMRNRELIAARRYLLRRLYDHGTV